MREHEPLYLHDIVLPEEVEKPRRGFDLDREFGEGTKERMVNALRDSVKRALEEGKKYDAVEGAAYLRLLTGERLGTKEEEEDILEPFRKRAEFLEFLLDRGDNPYSVVEDAAFFRILTGKRLGTKEKQERMIGALQKKMKSNLKQGGGDVYFVARDAAFFRILTGERFGTKEEQERMIETLQEKMKSDLEKGFSEAFYFFAERYAAYLRILRAHEIKFIPGKGIEIIDDAPEEYKKQDKIPLPEVRKF
jgi:hypothetical protein